MADPNQKYGHRYAQVAALDPTDTVAPLAMPNNSVKVGDLLP